MNNEIEWCIGDECVVSNNQGYGLRKGSVRYLGKEALFVYSFKNSAEINMAVVEHYDNSCECYRIEMLKKPETREQKAARERNELIEDTVWLLGEIGCSETAIVRRVFELIDAGAVDLSI